MSTNNLPAKPQTIEDFKDTITYGILQINNANIAAKTAAPSQALNLPDIVRNALQRNEPNLHKLVRIGSVQQVTEVCNTLLKRFITLNFSNSEENAQAIIYDFTNDLLIDHPDLTLPDIVFFFKHIRSQQGVSPEYRSPTNILTPLQLSKWLNLYVFKRKQEEEQLRRRAIEQKNRDADSTAYQSQTPEEAKKSAQKYREIIGMLAEKKKVKEQQQPAQNKLPVLTKQEQENALVVALNFDKLDAQQRKQADAELKEAMKLRQQDRDKATQEFQQRVQELEKKYPLKKKT
jgi:hypothetical protein